jgi:hypothetical protein
VRFAKVSGFYEDYLRRYYAARPGEGRLPYAEQYARLMAEGFGWADFHARHLNAMGVPSVEIVANAVPLQLAWARENNVSGGTEEIVAAQLAQFKPNAAFIQYTIPFSLAWYQGLKGRIPTLRKVLGWRCSPYSAVDVERFRALDGILTCNPRLVDEFESLGVPAALFNHGFEHTQLEHLRAGAQRDIDVFFAGSLVRVAGFHNERVELFRRLAKEGIRLYVHADIEPFSRLLLKKTLGLAAGVADCLGLSPLLEKKTSLYGRALGWRGVSLASLGFTVEPPLYGLDLIGHIHRAKICINSHIDSAGAFAGNARLFEVTGAGALLITDAKGNLADYFEPGKEVVTYRSAEECVEKVRWYLAHPAEARAIAEAGQRRCLTDHSFQRRAEQLKALAFSAPAGEGRRVHPPASV